MLKKFKAILKNFERFMDVEVFQKIDFYSKRFYIKVTIEILIALTYDQNRFNHKIIIPVQHCPIHPSSRLPFFYSKRSVLVYLHGKPSIKRG